MKFIHSTSTSILHVLLIAGFTAASTIDDYYQLSCGTPSTVATTASTLYQRTWYSDNNSTFSDDFSSTIPASTHNDVNVPQIPFSRARVFTSNFTYSFPVSPGPKFIRLYFYPSAYSSSTPNLSINDTEPYLTVQSNSGHILLRNFSAYLSVNSSSNFVPKEFYVQKEFYVHVSNYSLQLTFFPTPPCSYAFVNGIEIVSVPENLYYRPTNSPKLVPKQENQNFDLSISTALETTYRLRVGGTDLSLSQDSGHMSRLWVSDDQYLIGNFVGATGIEYNNTPITYTKDTPNYTAPVEVYETMRWMGKYNDSYKLTVNVTWEFEVDSGFNYLMRLHWCEISGINLTKSRVFDVYINEELAIEHVDIFAWVGSYTAVYRDFVVFIQDTGSSKGELQLAMHPNTQEEHWYQDILLNGLEIYKINSTDGYLNAPNPTRTDTGSNKVTPSTLSKHSHVLLASICVVTGVILLMTLLYYGFHLGRRKRSNMSSSTGGTNKTKLWGLLSSNKSGTTTRSGGGSSSLPSHLSRHFSLAEIRLATSDFSQSLIIGHGGFGNVYKGTVNTESGPTTVAIKRLNPLSGQGAREFTTEIELLSKLRHVHLVSLIGYCDDSGEMILVYEFMSRGTLREHLYPNSTGQMMPWCQRLQACVGAARGLHYLHTGTERMIIHRDVKSTNILVDESWVAKVSDFGLSKLGPVRGELSHVSTHVKGSFGYVDPEYYRRQQLTEKSDVYSFGVVLFEVLCGRAAVNPNLPKEQVNLRIWARKNQLSGTLDTIVDPDLKGQIAPECLRKFGEVAESCVRDEGVNRPSMVDVIWGLEFALQLQLESAAKTTVNGDYKTDTVYDENVATANMGSPITDTSARLIRFSEENSNWSSINNSSSGLFSNTTLQGGDGGSTDVFSQIFKPEGR